LDIPEDIDKSTIGCYVSLGKRLLDVLVLTDLEQKLKIHIVNPKEDLQIIVKWLGNDEKKIGKFINNLLGSVSFSSKLFIDVEEGKTYKKWVTLFDLLDDDLYDGEFAEEDDE
jgi:hypothetical protein